jgi:hypothetical protein
LPGRHGGRGQHGFAEPRRRAAERVCATPRMRVHGLPCALLSMESRKTNAHAFLPRQLTRRVQMPALRRGDFCVFTRIVHRYEHNARDKRHRGVLGRCRSVECFSACVRGDAECTRPISCAIPTALAKTCSADRHLSDTGANFPISGSSDRSFVVEILGLEDNVADDDM